MSVKFVIVGAARTGSTLLVRTLNDLPGVRCHGELLGEQVRGFEDGFDPGAARPQEREQRMQSLRRARDADPVGFIDDALSGAPRANGFKALYGALLDPRWQPVTQALITGGDVRFVHLLRHNGLRRYVSETVLKAGGPNHSGAGGRSEERVQVTIDVEEFKRIEREIEHQAGAVRELLRDAPVHELSYEALASNTPAAVAGVCGFLGMSVDACDIRPALRKVGSSDLADTVSNYEALLRDEYTRRLVLSE